MNTIYSPGSLQVEEGGWRLRVMDEDVTLEAESERCSRERLDWPLLDLEI